jgi:vancomycin resistance protein YoaR
VNKIRINWQYFILLVIVFTLIASYCFLNPFSNLLVSSKVLITQLGPEQRSNIALACKKLNGTILMPRQIFSFNKVVGPRTAHQGYSRSPSYLETDSPMTFGGGICLVSSVLYKNALELGLKINERTAHTRTTKCIPSGFDATVWYGQKDLRFTNNQNTPIKIEAQMDNLNLTISLYGNQGPQLYKTKLERIVHRKDKDIISVVVLRRNNKDLSLISKDLYRISSSFSDIADNKINYDKNSNRI